MKIATAAASAGIGAQVSAAGGAPEGDSPRCEYSIRKTQAVAAGLTFCFTAAISVFAAGPKEAGFCPVTSKPSLTT